MKLQVKYQSNKKGHITSVNIPIKQWNTIEKQLELLDKGLRKKERKKNKSSEISEIRDLASDTSSFSFWQNEKENLYQDYLRKK